MRAHALALIVAAGLAAPAAAADYLVEIPGQVFEAQGDAAALARRARTCIAQQLASGAAGGLVIVADDGSTLVANNALSYDSLGRWQLRSRVTIETRGGRIRIAHSQITRFNELGGGWDQVGKWTGSGWKAAAAALQRVTDDLATCIAAPPAAAAAW